MQTDVTNATEQAVQEMINANEPFTSACISHPIIKDDPDVRHFDVSETIKGMWRHGQMIANDGSMYVRSIISVWPAGPGTSPANAWLYHPDSYDPNDFKPRSRVLVRNDDDDGDDDAVGLSNTADGSSVQKQCQVQKVDTVINVPRTIIKKIGWNAGQTIDVEVSGTTIVIKKTASAKRKVDAEGRIRLYGSDVEALKTTSPTALLVQPTGADEYIQISAFNSPPATTTTPAPSDSDSDATNQVRGVSVWDK